MNSILYFCFRRWTMCLPGLLVALSLTLGQTQTYDPSGTTVAGSNSQGSEANQLNGPTGVSVDGLGSVSVDGLGSVYVADARSPRTDQAKFQAR